MANDTTFQPEEMSGPASSSGQDTFTACDAVLDRAKSVSQRITARVRALTEDTQNHSTLSNNPTDEQPPISK
jgi:hypothetical protein